jgi:D-alanine-D-alanine ligase
MMIDQLSQNQPSITNPRTSDHPDPIKVAVLRGGVGRERDVSLESGRYVAEALREGGFDVVTSDIRPDDMQVLDRTDIDVFFLALHGEFGEDGQLQEVLEGRGLIYTGSGPRASRLAFDKIAGKRLFAEAGVTVPAVVEFRPEMDVHELNRRLETPSGRLVVKPIRQGSSVGVHIVGTPQEAIETARQVHAEFGDCMIESFIRGRELTVGVLGRQTLPIIEIRSKTGFYDYHAKYISNQTQYLFDTVEQESIRARTSRAAIACFDALGCRDFARVDFILTDDGTPWALEVNTIPGFTGHSLLPKAAARTGLAMRDLCTQIVQRVYARRNCRVKP